MDAGFDGFPGVPDRANAAGLEGLLLGLTTHTPVGIFMSDATGDCRFVNRRWCELAGLEPEEALGDGWAVALHPADRDRVAAEWDEAARAGRDSVIAYRFLHRDGTVAWIEGYATAFRDPEGALLGWVGSCLDVTAHREAALALGRERELFSVAFEQAPTGMALIGIDRRFLRANAALCRSLGYDESALARLRIDQVTHPDDLPASIERVERLLAGELRSFHAEKRYLRADGTVFWALLSVALVRDEQGVPLYLVAHIEDVNERKLAEEELRVQAEHDPLTGLANRRRFERELARVLHRLEHGHEVTAGLILLDLDRFKQINDSCGHPAGDHVLEQVGRLLERRLRETDVVARLGGDEFAVLAFTDASEHLAGELLETIRTATFRLDGREERLTASAGVASIRSSDDPASLIAATDRALYAAKSAGRDRVATAGPRISIRPGWAA